MPDDNAALRKMQDAGAHPAELAAMRRRLEQLDDPQAGRLPGDVLQPLEDLPNLDDLPEPSPERARELLDGLAVVKLNGGLGTSMGLSGPKSLLQVKPDTSFLDVLAAQVLGLRERYEARLPLLLMNSASTRGPSLAALDRYPQLAVTGLPLDFLQGREPKLRADDLTPVEWPSNPDLEWCPPGHGDLYTALAASGTLDALLDAGLRWAFVSNSDNLGALADVRLVAWIADERVPFTMEAVRGTPADRKGGHLARRDGRVVLRETAQVPDGDTSFTDVERWRYYNTNNLWIDLRALRDLQAADPGAPALPLIVNRKTVDPRDKQSTPVIQLESAMGAAVGSIPGARAVQVPRTRFAPVKTTNDLLVVWSDAYQLDGEGRMSPTFDGPGPVVTLDDEHYKLVPDFERRFPAGAPSLRRCRRLVVEGDVTFGADVVVEGDVRVTGSRQIADGEVLRGVNGPAERAAAEFAGAFGGAPDGIWWAPGRVNLIGEHTDYQDGFVLPLALDTGVAAAARATDRPLLRARSLQQRSTVELPFAEIKPGAVDGWVAYVAGVAWALREAGHDVPGLDVVLDGNVPVGAGLSSSAALECSVAVAWNDLAGLGLSRDDLAAAARRAENDVAGAPTGVMDQMASLHGRAGHLVFLDTRSLAVEPVPFDPAAVDLALLVIDTKAPHALVDGEYAERHRSCAQATELLGVTALRDVSVDALDRALATLDDEQLGKRVRHVVTENARVLDVVAALRSGADPRRIGPTLTASHASMRDDFEITVPEVDTAVAAALDAGAHGARMTGGGFGGCVLALVEAERVEPVLGAVEAAYAAAGYRPPVGFVAVAADGAHRLDPAPAGRG